MSLYVLSGRSHGSCILSLLIFRLCCLAMSCSSCVLNVTRSFISATCLVRSTSTILMRSTPEDSSRGVRVTASDATSAVRAAQWPQQSTGIYTHGSTQPAYNIACQKRNVNSRWPIFPLFHAGWMDIAENLLNRSIHICKQIIELLKVIKNYTIR